MTGDTVIIFKKKRREVTPNNSMHGVVPDGNRDGYRPIVAGMLWLLLLGGAADGKSTYNRWAIIASRDVQKSGLADLLTVELSKVDGVELVERERLDAAMKELELAAMFGAKGAGKRLSAAAHSTPSKPVCWRAGRQRSLDRSISPVNPSPKRFAPRWRNASGTCSRKSSTWTRISTAGGRDRSSLSGQGNPLSR